MKRVLIAMLFMLPALACAEKKPVQNTSDYTIAVHVQSSETPFLYRVCSRSHL